MIKGMVAALVLAASPLGAGEARALAICACCAEQPGSTCGTACAAVTAEPNECTVFVDYAGKSGPRPLNGVSFRDISLGDPNLRELENFRRFIERHRRYARRDYKRAVARYDLGRLSNEDLAKAQALFDEAMVNYNHAAHAYLVRIGRKTD